MREMNNLHDKEYMKAIFSWNNWTTDREVKAAGMCENFVERESNV
jgi:hypothetical protein